MGNQLLPQSFRNCVYDPTSLIKTTALAQAARQQPVPLENTVFAVQDGDAPQGGEHEAGGGGIDQGAEIVSVNDIRPQMAQGPRQPPASPPIPTWAAAQSLHDDARFQSFGKRASLLQAEEGHQSLRLGHVIGQIYHTIFHAARLKRKDHLSDFQWLRRTRHLRKKLPNSMGGKGKQACSRQRIHTRRVRTRRT